MIPNKKFVLFFTLLFSISTFSQTTLLGKITNNKGEPIMNAAVYLDTVKSKAISNSIGFFQVDVPDDVKEITLFSQKYGYLTAKYNKEKRLSFIFLEPKKEHSDTGNIGSNMNTLDVGKDKNVSNYRDIYEYLDGRIAGVTVTNSNEITIRGGSSWELSNKPLFVVDGVVVSSIGLISPSNVDKIRVLKGVDASIYGVRGSNGVIEITTK